MTDSTLQQRRTCRCFPGSLPSLKNIVLWLATCITAGVSAASFPAYYYPDPGIWTNGKVRALLFHEGTLYAGGSFTEVTGSNGTRYRSGVAAFDVATGEVTRFEANTNYGTVRALAAGSGKLFIGGSFSRINGSSQSGVAAVDPVSGEVVGGFRENGRIDGRVWALACSGNRLYCGGNFTDVDGFSRNYLAALDCDSGTLIRRFNPSPSEPLDDSGKTPGGVYALQVHPLNGEILFIGGNFQALGDDHDRRFLVAVNSDGSPGPKFRRTMRYPVIDLDAGGAFLCVGVGGYGNRAEAHDIGSVPYRRHWKSLRVHGDVQAVAYVQQGYVIMGFHDGLFDSTYDDYRMAVLDAENGELYDWYPQMNSFMGVRVLDASDSCFAAGGEFTSMNGMRQQYLALFRRYPFPPFRDMPLDRPRLLYPPDSITGMPVSPHCKWYRVAGASEYELQLAEDSLYTRPVKNRSGISDTACQTGDLGHVATCWWRVRAGNGALRSGWSESRSFITAPGKGDIPVLLYPVSGAMHQQVTCDLGWKGTATALSYTVQVSDTMNFRTLLLDRTEVTDTFCSVSGLLNETGYFWRVNAKTAGGVTGWNKAGFTTIMAAPGTPHCITPADRAGQIGIRPSLVWGRVPDASVYTVQLSVDSGFSGILWTGRFTDTTAILPLLEKDRSYFWRVNAVNIGGNVWSEPYQFTTVYPLPQPPEPVSPPPGFAAETDWVRLVWNRSIPHVTRYSILIARDSLMEDVAESVISDTQIIKYRLEDGSVLWWQVKAYNESGWGGYSEKRRFDVRFPVEPTFRFSLERFTLTGMTGLVVYTVADNCDVSMELLDLKGNSLWKKRRRGRTPGRHVEKLPLNRFQAGHYFLRFKAGEFEKKVQTILVR